MSTGGKRSKVPSGGAFAPIELKRVKRLASVSDTLKNSSAFEMKPEGTEFSVHEGVTPQIAPTQGTKWDQLVAKPSKKMSTEYKSLFPALESPSDLSRANKALISGGGITKKKESGRGAWRAGKSYSHEAQLTATLLRVNETFTAFGNEWGSAEHDVGAGMMSEALARKWKARNKGVDLGTKELGEHLTNKFPQLDTVEKMRKEGPGALRDQVAKSRMKAAVAAARRGREKGKSDGDIDAYVQHKFAKHGLGDAPSGWRDKFEGTVNTKKRARASSSSSASTSSNKRSRGGKK